MPEGRINLILLLAMPVLYGLWFVATHIGLARAAPWWLWLMLVLAVATLTPLRKWPVVGMIFAVLAWVLWKANQIKKELMFAPLSELDFEIVMNNPHGFLDAIGISRAWQTLIPIIISLLFLAVVLRVLWRYFKLPCTRAQVSRKVAVAVVKTVFASSLFALFYADYGNYVYRHKLAWDPLTPLGFLAYSHAALRQPPHRGKTSPPLVMDILMATLKKYWPGLPVGKTPNIVFVLAESTFDPNAVFQLNGKVENTLFTSTNTGTGGLLHVTPVGGGTWRTEFETVTGIDSRPFGFRGLYTHISLSPQVKQSFATYLRKYGYQTQVFYPVDGEFYMARDAYRNYGFASFKDASELGLEKDWAKFTDAAMMDRIKGFLAGDSDKPFFDYIVLLQNHSPHNCRNFDKNKPFLMTLIPNDNFEHNCRINEYALRAKSTETAFNKLVAELERIEHATDRPFIAVIFGDHQPGSFVGPDFRHYRKPLSIHTTFYKLVTSKSISLIKPQQIFHATLFPTLISTAVAKDIAEIYMPENFYVQEKCGVRVSAKKCPEALSLMSTYLEYLNFSVP